MHLLPKEKENIVRFEIKNLRLINSKQKYIKILEVIFDTKNTWTQHIKTLRKESLPRINMLKSIARTSWGVYSKPILQVGI